MIQSNLLQVIRRNVTAVWIGSTSWIISARLTALPNIQAVGTIIGFMDKTQDLDLLTAYTQELFTKLSEERANTTPPAQRSTGFPVNPCPQCWNLSPANLSLVTGSGVKHTSFSVYAAIYSVAQALHNLLGCNSTACVQGPKTKILPWKVIYFSFGLLYSWNMFNNIEINLWIHSYFAAVGGFKEYFCRHKWHTFKVWQFRQPKHRIRYNRVGLERFGFRFCSCWKLRWTTVHQQNPLKVAHCKFWGNFSNLLRNCYKLLNMNTFKSLW